MSDNDISRYRIGLESSVSSESVKRILNGDIKNPRNRTLDAIINYLEKKIVASQSNYELKEGVLQKAAETSEDYFHFENLTIDKKLNIIYQKIENLSNIILGSLIEKEDASLQKTSKKEGV